jgi:hypothetical protein
MFSSAITLAILFGAAPLAAQGTTGDIIGGKGQIGQNPWCIQSDLDNKRCVYQSEAECLHYVLPDQGKCVENEGRSVNIPESNDRNVAEAPLGNQDWCADLHTGAPRCAYTSMQDCKKFVLPQDGTCVRNPDKPAETTGSAPKK